jgi:hypothetical protein
MSQRRAEKPVDWLGPRSTAQVWSLLNACKEPEAGGHVQGVTYPHRFVCKELSGSWHQYSVPLLNPKHLGPSLQV